MRLRIAVLALAVGLFVGGGLAAEPGPLGQWRPLWARDDGKGRVVVDEGVLRGGKPTICVEHGGRQDWSLTSQSRMKVVEGDIIELSAWLKVKGSGRGEISVTTYDAKGKVIEWMYGLRAARAGDWRSVRSRFIVPKGIVSVEPRLTGVEPATVWMHEFVWKNTGNLKTLRAKGLPQRVTVSNKAIEVTFDTAGAALTVRDRRTGRDWVQRSTGRIAALRCVKVGGGIDARLLDGATGLEIDVKLRLDGESSELIASLSGDGELNQPMRWPEPFVTGKGTYLVVPMNEGISYPVDDKSIRPRWLIAYGGHGISMPFWGVTDGAAGQMAIIETPDDASIAIERTDGMLHVSPRWDPQKGRFGYERRLRYVFFDRGGYVAMCKRYRAHARKTGLLHTLAEKRKKIPAVDQLVGAVNVWCWERDAVGLLKQMQQAGIERILWSNRRSPEALRTMNAMGGVLTSRYDIFQDVMDPANFKRLRYVHPDWTTAAWPDDLMLDAEGSWRRGWRVKDRDGKMHPCGVLCDRQAIGYADKRLTAELKTHPYKCRFIDTTTASPWRECYDPDHPMTRTDSRIWKMKLLGLMSGKFKLVTGSETGHDAAVPYVHYFEGMMSLGPYRVPDAGRDMARIWDDVPERVAKFQLGHRYRLPLWELVYHDCVVTQWYWGDYNNKLPALWLKRDLFNVLYGTPPMFMFRNDFWRKNKARFARSYRTVCPLVRKVGYAEMTDHRFLTDNRDVQQTTFAGGTTVTVNFGDTPYAKGDLKVAAMSSHISGAE